MTAIEHTSRPRGRKLLRRASLLVLAAVVASWLPVLLLRWIDPPVTAFMLIENQASLEATRYDWRDRADLGEEAALAVMAAEDQRFPLHHGVDPTAIRQALDERRAGKGLRGGSGITQQVAKNLFLWSGRSLVRKGLEAWFAVLIDLSLPKRRILEIYLNIAEFGPGLYGVPAASRQYFGKEAGALTAQEAALLAAVLPNPNRLNAARPSAYVRERQAWIVPQAQRLRREGWLRQIEW